MIDNVSSLMVPYGYEVTMFDSATFSGDFHKVTGPSFLDNNLNMRCVNISDVFNDRMASAIIRRTGAYGSARGYWKGLTATETFTFSVHYGWNTATSTETIN